MGGGSMALSFGSASGCNEDDFDFYYKSFGGFVEGTDKISSINFTPGQDDTYDDGFWYREGPFSAPVYYGDPENDGKRYADDPNGAWPAWTWGHPEADPFVSAGGPGDNLGGAAGIGTGGFGMGDGNKIKVDDNASFYPITFVEVNNNRNSFFGSYSAKVSWNVALYDKKHNEVFKKNYTTTLSYWETLNFQYTPIGIVCPRSSVAAGETINDLAYSQTIHDEISSRWPVSGLDVTFVGDGKSDAEACADAVQLADTYKEDTFSVRPFRFGPAKKYKIVFDGPYIYDETKEGCPALNEEGLPDTTEKWPAQCFERVETLWADEGVKTRAFMRMHISEVKQNPCEMGMKFFKSSKAGMASRFRAQQESLEQKKEEVKGCLEKNLDHALETTEDNLDAAQSCGG